MSDYWFFVKRKDITVHPIQMEFSGEMFIVVNDSTGNILSSAFKHEWEAEAWRQRYFANHPEIKEN